MTSGEILKELKLLATERTKNIYLNNGAREPLFGVATGAMKPMVRKIKINQPLAEELYATGNYDAMYLAGMIADPKAMTYDDYERWMQKAYFFMISDYIVAVTLAEADIEKATTLSNRWIDYKKKLYMSAGYSCYCWLLGSRKDSEFDGDKLDKMLDIVSSTIHKSPPEARYAMNNFISTIGVSYLPLHDKALSVAESVGPVEVIREGRKISVPIAYDEIRKMASKGRLGFKRKYVRC